MLPPQLRQGLILVQRQSLATLALKATSTHLLRACLSHSQHRTFFGWRRRSGDDYSSHLDPMYQRFCRFRTLKTRAKLLKNLRRRGKFNWDFESRPFFTPQLVRWASHWDEKHRQRWYLEEEKKAANAAEEAEAKKVGPVEEEGFELSAREKEWKEKMEIMRKRIEKDPYEAIFGKRFEPFWSPLVPSWMREEMGLQGWPKYKDTQTPKQQSEPTTTVKNETAKAKEEGSVKTVKNETADKTKPKEPERSKMETATATPTIKAEQRSTHSPQSSSYSYASSTSWDSWSNKTKRVEWDSVSGQTRKYEYDPISNRMIQVEAPKPVPAATEKRSFGTTVSPAVKETSQTTPEQQKKSAQDEKSSSIPVKQSSSSDLRKSIPIPPPLSQPSLGWSKMSLAAAATTTANTSIGPWKTTALASDVPKSAALTKLSEPEKEVKSGKGKSGEDIESLTADKVRASMGKSKIKAELPSTSEAPKTLITAPGAKTSALPIRGLFSEVAASSQGAGRTRSEGKKSTEWDQAEMSVMLDKELESLQKKKEKLVKDEKGLFHIERQKRELQKLDERISEVTRRVERLSGSTTNVPEVSTTSAITVHGIKKMYADRVAKQKPSTDTTSSPAPSTLQSSLSRMQSKELPKVVELDDSAAHESTEAIAAAVNAVPKNWAQQAELLQADRVRRTTSKHPHPPAGSTKPSPAPPTRPMNRWIDDMRARQSAIEAKKAEEKAAADKQNASRNAILEKANAMLEAEVKETKFKMQAHENRYAHKIRALRGELETAYKQSTVHSEKHLDRIRWLEEELGKVTKAADGVWAGAAAGAGKGVVEVNKREFEKMEKKLRDRELVREVREIYERAYGTIDAAHRQQATIAPTMEGKEKKAKQVVEVESDVDLGEALAKYERETPQAYALPPKDRALENEIARDERAYWETQQGALFENAKEKGKQLGGSFRLPSISAQPAKNENAEAEEKLVDDMMPKLIPTELTKPDASASETTREAQTVVNNGIAWADPPIYKVLAYDSGNDMMSTATTTSNFTTSEQPISIPQALSQLYNPARFVPYFAELQKDGYQVIFGTTDLLVFKKVKGEKMAGKSTVGGFGLEDHGLYQPFESSRKLQEVVAGELGKERSTAVNPIDGTSKPATGNFASPTGFVNHDSVVPAEDQAVAQEHPSVLDNTADLTEEQQATLREASETQEDEQDIEWRHYPRVRRMEQHFTGSRRRWNSNHRRHKRAEERGEREFGSSRARKSTLRWIVGVGLGTAGVMYLVGTVAQRSRISKEEDWARRAEEERRRWRS